MDSLMEEILERAVEADDDSLGNNPDILESSVVTVEPPRTEDTKAEKMASELNDFSPPAATTIDVPPPTTIDVPVSEITPATDIHPLLAEYAAKLAACRSVNTAQNLWHKYVGDQVMNTDFSDDLMALGTDMRNEKLKALRAKEEATQRELV